MMIYRSDKIVNSCVIAGDEDLHPGKYTQVDCKGMRYDIIYTYTFKKDDPHPEGLLYIIFKKKIDKFKLWERFKMSEVVQVFVVQE
jgi:hypothetical protein